MSKCREAFEQIYCGNNKHNIQRNEHGDYVYPSVRDAYAGWQAAWNARGKVDSAIVKTYDYARFANECVEAIEKEDEK